MQSLHNPGNYEAAAARFFDYFEEVKGICSTKCCCKFVQLLTLTNKLAANVEGFTKMGKVAHNIIC